MIVYGDPARREPLERCVETLNLMLEQAESADLRPARVRGLVERAGELEQALFDAPDALGTESARARGLAAARRVTTLAAEAFDRSCSGRAAEARREIGASHRALAPLRRRGGTLVVKVPEGFAFYGLMLQSYREQALGWARHHESATDRRVLVVGIRTIGTTLSAVVAAALRGRGFGVKRITVRPSGHPSDRRVEQSLPQAPFGIVVDEGPGLSGSSMLAVADAMRRSGVEEIALLPAHARGPGAGASAELRVRWRSFRPYPAQDSPPRFGDRTLAEELWTGVRTAYGELASATEVGGGAWRTAHDGGERAWPAVLRALERSKLLCASRDGARILFKYCGHATAPGMERTLAAQTARRSAPLAAQGFAPRLLGEMHGFVAWEWVEGRPLGIQDASFPFLARMGAYIARAALPPLSAEEAHEARERTAAMLRANAGETLGADAVRAAEAEFRKGAVERGVPAAGDGHLAPHEWVRSRSGSIVKTDVGGHDVDHTWTGPQPVVWDLAGALEEWDLHGAQAEALLRGYQEAGGAPPGPAALHAYRTAYAAHRAGQTAFFAEMERDAAERARLDLARERWRDQLTRCLAGDTAGAPR
ncbi:MAG TPA: hypothetical protein VE326_05945 [Candidatus Binatia bacterium]|nr:hypothetical protein [Candidatus Binatia bacterium]